MLWNTVGCLMYQGCLWAITILVVTLSGYTNSGSLAFAMAIGNIFFPLATYNVRTYQVSDVQSEFTQGNYVAFRLLTISMALLLILIYVFFSTPSLELILATISWLMFKTDEAFCNVYYGIEQKHGHMDFIGISQGIRGICVIVFFSIILAFTQNIDLAIIAMTAPCICVTFLYDQKKAFHLSEWKISISKAKAIDLLKKCFPSMLTLLCYGAAPSLARQLYESADGTYLLGVYAAIATPTVLVQVAASYLYSPFIEPMSKALHEGNITYMKSVIARITLTIIAICIVSFAASFFWGTELLGLVFGDSIKEFGYVLPFTMLVAAAIASMGFFIEIMTIYRHLYIALIANAIALVISAISSLPCIYYFGMNGLNIALTFAFVLSLFIGCILFIVIEKSIDRNL